MNCKNNLVAIPAVPPFDPIKQTPNSLISNNTNDNYNKNSNDERGSVSLVVRTTYYYCYSERYPSSSLPVGTR